MADTTVRQMLQDAITLLNSLAVNPDLSTTQQNTCSSLVTNLQNAINNLSAGNIIVNGGVRTTTVTTLQVQGIAPMILIDRSGLPSNTELTVYNALDRINDATALIFKQLASDNVTY